MNVAESVIYIDSCATNEMKPEMNKIAGMDFEKIFSFASYHVINAVVAMALESARVKNEVARNST